MTKQAKARDTSNRHHPYRRQGGPDVKEKKKDPFGRNHHPFNANKKRASRYEAYLATGMQELIKGNLNDFQLHAPHRLPFAALRSAIKQAIGKQENVPQVIALLMPSVLASNECEKAFENVGLFSMKLSPKDRKLYEDLSGLYAMTALDLRSMLLNLFLDPSEKNGLRLLSAANNLAANAPGLGPAQPNMAVSDALHANSVSAATDKATYLGELPLTPRSAAAVGGTILAQRFGWGEKLAFGAVQDAGEDKETKQSVVLPTGGQVPLKFDFNKTVIPARWCGAENVVFRGALLVKDNKVYKPKDHKKDITNVFSDDWVLVE